MIPLSSVVPSGKHNLSLNSKHIGRSILTKPNDGNAPAKQDNTCDLLLKKNNVNENPSQLSLKQGPTAGPSMENCSPFTLLQLLSSSLTLSFLSLQRLLAFVWGWMRLNRGAHQCQLNNALAAVGCKKPPKTNSSFSMSLSEPFISRCVFACLCQTVLQWSPSPKVDWDRFENSLFYIQKAFIWTAEMFKPWA